MIAFRNAQMMLVALFMCGYVSFGAEIVVDPLKDFLHLKIQDRYTAVSEITRVTELTVDMNGDGNMEMFIGHPQLWHGDNTGLYCAVYAKVDGRFIRLTPVDSDIRIDQRFFGDPATTFAGYINEVSREGVLVLTNEFFQENLMKFDSAKVYSIVADKIAITDLGAIDRTTKQGQEFYDRYFGKGVKTRSIEMDEFSSTQLQERGYQLPSWKPRNAETEAPTEDVLMTPSPRIALTPEATRTLVPSATPQPTTSPTQVASEAESSSGFPTVPVAIFVAVIVGIVLYLLRRKST
jgi:hypothetical protein